LYSRYKYCTKETIDKDTCSTPKCSKDNECYSEICYNNNCIVNTNKSKTIYMCTSSSTNINCKKRDYMTCKEDTECLLTSNCVDGICIPEDTNKKETFFEKNGIAIFIILLIIGIICYEIYISNKTKKRVKRSL